MYLEYKTDILGDQMRFIALLVAGITFLALPYGANAGELPVQGAVTSGVGWRPDPFGSGRNVYHRGIDIAVPEGTPVRATDAGTVTYAGVHGGHGLTVIVSHGDGSETLYGHNKKLLVAKGERVDGETVLALSGNSGRSTGPHVHYEIRGKGVTALAVYRTPIADSANKVATASARRESEEKMLEIANDLRQSVYSFKPVAPATDADMVEDEV